MKNGLYWLQNEWKLEVVNDGRELGTLARRVPLAVAVLAAPLMGALFVVFLPLIGFALVLDFLARKTYNVVHEIGNDIKLNLKAPYAVGEVYFAQRKKKSKGTKKGIDTTTTLS